MAFKPISFAEAIPRLVATYHKGKLVPFTGAGLSAPSIPTWSAFLKNLSICAGENSKFNKETSYTAQELIQFSEEIVTELTRRSRQEFIRCVKQSIGYSPGSRPLVTPQCKSLARIYWPLILSTNYDTLFLDALRENQKFNLSQLEVFGRNASDCHSVLATLQTNIKSAYWAIQGFFGEEFNKGYLENEIVVGYRQYRNATYNNPTFRSVFAEIFRNYSLFFIGTGLSEDYFKGLFGEVIEKFGGNPYTHCALFNEKDIDSVDHHFLHTKFNITAVYYSDDDKEKFSGLPRALDSLREAINEENQKFWKISFATKSFSKSEIGENKNNLEIVAGQMPERNNNECYVFSAGWNNQVLFSHIGINYTEKHYHPYGKFSSSKFESTNHPHVYCYDKSNIYAAIARNLSGATSSRDARDLRLVLIAIEQTLLVTNEKYDVVNVMIIAAGSGKPFPAVYSFIQMLRGYKRFVEKNTLKATVRFHIVDPSVISFFRTKPFEIEELLNCDDVRINIEIRDEEEIERYQLYVEITKTMNVLSKFYAINPENWSVTIYPTPYLNHIVKSDDEITLEDLGLIPDSLVIYTRIKAKNK